MVLLNRGALIRIPLFHPLQYIIFIQTDDLERVQRELENVHAKLFDESEEKDGTILKSDCSLI